MSVREADHRQPQIFKEPEWMGFHHEGYDVVPFSKYVSIRGDRSSNTGLTAEMRMRQRAASTQSELTFGLVEAVIEKRVSETMLVRRNESGRLVMTTIHLIDIIQDWVVRVTQTEENALEAWLDRVHLNLRQAHSLMVYFTSSRFAIFRPLGDDAPAMVCFAAVISEALVNGRMAMVSSRRFPQQGFSWSMIWINEYREAVRRAMVMDGWCPFTVEYLVTSSSVSSLRYASKCGPPQDGRHHKSCSSNSCTAYDIDVETYTPKHATACKSLQESPETTCEYSKPSLHQVIQYISQGDIPVITLAEGSNDAPVRLEVHKSSDTPYVAVSHVWADGLGSNTETGLPTCQLRRLVALVSELRPGAAFWTDSLCIPDAKDARKKAIKMMARTYQEAESVLVLDGGLQTCKSTEPDGRKILRVLTSGWMRRLWTLQEATLAKQLSVLFADAQVGMADLIPKANDMLWFPHLTDMAAELFRLTKQSTFGDYKIGDVARSLRWRSTNRSSDETLAIASLLGVQPSALVDLPPEERMARLIREVVNMPRNVLFLIGEKLKAPGFRWAPKSLMAAHGGSQGGLEMSTRPDDAVWTPLGLKAIYSTFYFPKTEFRPGTSWKVRDEKASRLYAVRDLSSEGGGYQCDMLLFEETIPFGNASPCVSALRSPVPPKVEADGSFTVYCEYKRRIILVPVMDDDDMRGVVTLKVSGKAQVCVS